MNVLLLTMSSGIENFQSRGIYTDLMRKFRDEGHDVYIVFPRERRHGLPSIERVQDGVLLLGVKTLNVTKTNIIEKGIGQVSIEFLYKRAIKKYFKNVSFDLILYSTPPITFPNVIEYVKKMSPYTLNDIGKRAKDFICENKSPLKQTQKIIELIKQL